LPLALPLLEVSPLPSYCTSATSTVCTRRRWGRSGGREPSGGAVSVAERILSLARLLLLSPLGSNTVAMETLLCLFYPTHTHRRSPKASEGVARLMWIRPAWCVEPRRHCCLGVGQRLKRERSSCSPCPAVPLCERHRGKTSQLLLGDMCPTCMHGRLLH